MTKDASWGHSKHVHIDAKIPWYEISDGLPQQTSASAVLPKVAEEYVARRKGGE
jgi:hypothetical protein